MVEKSKKPGILTSVTRYTPREYQRITQEIYKRNYELAETNKTLSLLRTIDALALTSQQSLEAVCSQIAQAITEVAEYPFVGIFTRSLHSHNELLLHGYSLKEAQSSNALAVLTKPLHLKLSHSWLMSPEQAKLIPLENVASSQVQRFLNCSVSELEFLHQQLPLKTLYVIKLFARHRLVGVITVGFLRSVDTVASNDTLLVDRISESIGLVLDSKLLFEENRYVLKKLRETNVKLRALDETKDDFISMASHQLRTPLTSVKGYISMVLEGDAGTLNKVQRDMLNQAFFSSQRMVYLIADLLNVSRLKTGKFVIEASRVDLATMIQQEVEQLKETASARQLELVYEKPKDFPEVVLDETKTRQVVMNFIDNAIYYTPAGGHINVKLISNPATIELRVEDNGIGVARSDRPHLFTKFYRASNARKARPDGTGLGLFMAKKVILAEGGSILFESEEGKGSTFGFAFSKAKVLPAKPA